MMNAAEIIKLKSENPKVCLTVAGHDPSGGAGIVADIETFSAFGCFATGCVTSLTFQNTTGVFGAVHQSAEAVRGQIEPVLDDFTVAALKTGMLPTREIIVETANIIKQHQLPNLVVDPVVRSTSGYDLIDDDALQSLIRHLFPLAVLVTPNLPEAEKITRMPIRNETDVERAARIMQSLGAVNVLIKGGHLFPDEPDESKIESKNKNKKARDFLFTGDDLKIFETDFIETTATHGTGCTLSAAITANLALERSLRQSVEIAKNFVTEAIRTAPPLGKGHSSINRLLKDFSRRHSAD